MKKDIRKRMYLVREKTLGYLFPKRRARMEGISRFMEAGIKRGLLGNSFEVIFQTDDVIFAEISALLDFDEDQGLPARIQYPVGGHAGNIYRLSRGEPDFFSFEGDDGFPFHDDPVFVPLLMPLVAESFQGQDFYSFDLVRMPLIQNRIASPRTPFNHGSFPRFSARQVSAAVCDLREPPKGDGFILKNISPPGK